MCYSIPVCSNTSLTADEEPCFVGRDQNSKWKKNAPRKSIRTKAKDVVKQLPGYVEAALCIYGHVWLMTLF